MKPLEFKSGSPIEDIDVPGRTVIFYASVFDNTDSDNDIIRKGAYTKTITENGPAGKNRIMHLYQHYSDRVISKPFELMEDAKGLLVKTVFPDTELAEEVLKLYDAGVLTEHSVGIQVMKAFWPGGEGYGQIREIQEAKLYEVSTVTWGANDQAQFIGTKAEQKIKAFDYMDKLIAAVRKGRFKDDTFELLEFELKKIQAYIHSLEIPEPVPPATQKDENEPDLLESLILTFKNSVK